MQLTVFWRVILTQLVLIVLVLTMSVAALFQLQKQSELATDLLTRNAVCLAEEKRLLELFLFQRRSAEKYLLLHDQAFLEHFLQGSREFTNSLATVAELIKTREEHALVEQLRTLQAQYSAGLATSGTLLETWKQERTAIADRIIAGVNELLRIGEARHEAASQAVKNPPKMLSPLLRWLFFGAISLVIVLAYALVRSISYPLTQVASELRQVGQGDFDRSLRVRGPSEVADTIRAFNDMTAQLAELDALQSDFLAQMSHELRTPLTAIQEGSALLLEEIPGVLNTPQREIIQVVRDNSERLFRQLASILELSKMEARKMEYAVVATDLVMLVKRAVEAIGPSVQKKHIRITLNTPAPLPVMYLDEDRIRQVLDNLLSNAVKFTPERGEIRVSTALRRDEKAEESWAEIRVSDSGVGVRPEETEQIFQKFYQSSLERRQASRGSGLGLAIARHIVEAHSGKIWVESRAGEGATFIVNLPIRREPENGLTREVRRQHRGERNAL